MKPSEILRTAMGYVEKGWCKRELVDPSGNVCALGAIKKAAHPSPSIMVDATVDALIPAFMERLNDPYVKPLWCYNDAADTTKTDVLVAMEKAAIGLEEKGQ